MNDNKLLIIAAVVSLIGISAETIGALGIVGKLHIFPTLNYSLIAGGALFTLIALSACIIASSNHRRSKLALFITLLAGTLTSAACLGYGCHGVLPFSLSNGLILGLYFLAIALVVSAIFIAQPKSSVKYALGVAAFIMILPIALFILGCCVFSGGDCFACMSDSSNFSMTNHTGMSNASRGYPKRTRQYAKRAEYPRYVSTKDAAAASIGSDAISNESCKLPAGPDTGSNSTPSLTDTYLTTRAFSAAADGVFSCLLGR